MTSTDQVLAHVRMLLRRHAPFNTMTRDDLDLMLADLEADLRHELGEDDEGFDEGFDEEHEAYCRGYDDGVKASKKGKSK